MFDFDARIDRRGTNCMKWDNTQRLFGLAGLEPYWIADSDWAAPPCITKALQERIAHPIYGYSFGGPDYGQIIANWFQRRYGWDVQPDWVVPGEGVMVSLALAVEDLTEPGDRVVTLTPIYDSFFAPVRGIGRELVQIPLLEEDLKYQIDFEALERELACGAKVLLFCNPHNPVGRVWCKEELLCVVELCRKYHVFIISDDSHCDLVAPGYTYCPIASLPGAEELTITFTAPSKTFNVAGAGASNAILPNRALRERMIKCFVTRLIRGSNLFAYTVCRAGYAEGGPWLDEQMSYLSGNMHCFQDYLRENLPELRMTPWEGTFLAWVDFRSLGMSSREIMDKLAANYGVGVNNGANYGPGGEGFMRVNMACTRDRVMLLCDVFRRFCQEQRR